MAEQTERVPAAPALAGRRAAIEVLRLAAIAAITLFHVFQQTAASALAWASTGGAAIAAAGADPGALMGASAPVLVALGCVNLLGAYGNHVFFAISGCFLVPRAADASTREGYWRDEARATWRRIRVILAAVVLYALVSVALRLAGAPLPNVSARDLSWLVGGLQFIWVYLVLIAATPVMGWAWRRVPARGAVLAAFVAVVFALNAYIAFVSPGGEARGLLEWRKLMSAVSYLAAYLVGAALGERDRARGIVRARAAGALAAIATASIAAMCAAATLGRPDVIGALTFKSTSALSFSLAMASLALALSCPGRVREGAGAAAAWLARGTLGLYIFQSMLDPLWRPLAASVCSGAFLAGWAAAPGAAAGTWAGLGCMLAAGSALALAMLAAFLVFDRVVRGGLPLGLGR